MSDLTNCTYPDCQACGYGLDLMNNGKPYSCPRLVGNPCGEFKPYYSYEGKLIAKPPRR